MIIDFDDLEPNDKLCAFRAQKLVAMGQATSDSLAAYIVYHRLIGSDELIANACMQELSYRRELGETFAFENYIEEKMSIKSQPKFQAFNLGDLLSVKSISSLIKGG